MDTQFDPSKYRWVIESLLSENPTSYPYFQTSGVSQKWAFDLNMPHGASVATAPRVDDISIQHNAVGEINAIYEKINAAENKESQTQKDTATRFMHRRKLAYVATATWAHYAIPLRWSQNSFFYLKSTGDDTDPLSVIRVEPEQIPLQFSQIASRIGKNFPTTHRNLEAKIFRRNCIIAGLVVAVAIFLLKK